MSALGHSLTLRKKAFYPLSTMNGHCGTDSVVQANQRAALLCYPATTKGIARKPYLGAIADSARFR
jgi:hypothetical protein